MRFLLGLLLLVGCRTVASPAALNYHRASWDPNTTLVSVDQHVVMICSDKCRRVPHEGMAYNATRSARDFAVELCRLGVECVARSCQPCP